MYIARSKAFEKQYKKLPKATKKQFVERLYLFLENENNPLLKVHSLAGEYRGLYSFNVNADIRAVFGIKDDTILFFIAIGSHSELYK